MPYLRLVSPEVAPIIVSPEYYANNIDDERDLACTYLRGHILRLIEDRFYINYAVDTRPLCAYLVDCYDVLNRLVGNNAYLAVRVKANNKYGHRPIIGIAPEDFPSLPNILQY